MNAVCTERSGWFTGAMAAVGERIRAGDLRPGDYIVLQRRTVIESRTDETGRYLRVVTATAAPGAQRYVYLWTASTPVLAVRAIQF